MTRDLEAKYSTFKLELGQRIVDLYSHDPSIAGIVRLLREEGHHVGHHYVRMVLQDAGMPLKRRYLHQRAGYRVFNVCLNEEDGGAMNQLCSRYPTLTTSDVATLAIRLMSAWQAARDRLTELLRRRPTKEDVHLTLDELFLSDPVLGPPTVPCPPPEWCPAAEG